MARDETPGPHFDRVMKEFADTCAKAKLKPNDTACDILKLKPADPLATEEGRFAHSIKIPNPLPEDSGYRSGMTPQEYFDHLCKTEAGEFIYKTVENVDGLYMMRPRERANDYTLQHLYALEDPYAISDIESEAPQKLFINPPWWNYKFFEVLASGLTSNARSATGYLHYFGYVQGKSPMKVEEVTAPLRVGMVTHGVASNAHMTESWA